MTPERVSHRSISLLGCVVITFILLTLMLCSCSQGIEVSDPKIAVPTPVLPDAEVPIRVDISGPYTEIEITWSHDGDGEIVHGQGEPAITFHTPSQPGLYHVRVEVRAGRQMEYRSIALQVRHNISLTIDTPYDGKQVDVHQIARGHYAKMPIGWRLWGVTQNPDGRYFLYAPTEVPAGDGEWSLDAYFGDRTYGIGSEYRFSVIAVQADSEVEQQLIGRSHGSGEPLPPEGPYLHFSEPVTVKRIGPLDHWYVDYWADTEMKSGEVRSREDIENPFIFKNWGVDTPAEELAEDGWSARFVRRVQFPLEGTYRFYVERDDGARVWLDGEMVIDAWGESALTRESAEVWLAQGHHEIAVDFFDSEQVATLGFWYEGPEPPLEPPPITGSYWRVDYFPNTELKHEPVWYEPRSSRELDLYWGDDKGAPIGGQGTLEMLEDHFSTRSTRRLSFNEGIYEFDVKGDDGVRFKVDDQVVLEEGEAWKECNPCRVQVDLAEGEHTLVVEQWDTVQDAHVSLKWNRVSPAWESTSNPYAVRAMAVDAEYVWTGGNGGLVRWDKHTLSPEVFRSEDGLPDNLVNALLVDRGGTLWVGTGEGYAQGGSGLGRYDGANWQTFTTADGLCDNAIFGLFQDHDGSLWVSTGWGLGHYDEAAGEWHCYHPEDGLASNYPWAIYRDSQGNLWVSAGGAEVSGDKAAVNVLRSGSWEVYRAEEIGTDSWGLEPVLEDNEGNLWFGSWNGAFRWDSGRWQHFTKEDGLPSNAVLALAKDDSGNVWFGTTDGVARYDGRTWQTFTVADGLASDYVTRLVVDQDGILWAGHAGDVGLSYFASKRWFSSPSPEGTLTPNRITSIHQDQAGKLWFGTGFPPTESGDGVRTFDGTTWQAFGVSDCLKNSYIEVIFEDRDSHLWFGYGTTGSGVTRFDGESCRTFTTSEGLAGDQVNDIIQASDGSLWFGTSDGGVSVYDGQDWYTFDADNSNLPSSDISALYQDSASNLWFGTRQNGVVRYNGESWQVFTTDEGLVSNRVTDIVEDADGVLWVGTYDEGISAYDPGEERWLAYQQAEGGLLSNRVYTLRVDKSGWVWVGTPDGVSCYTGRRWFSFTPADGMASRHVQAIWEDGQGIVWLGTGGGISRLQFIPTEAGP